ncbi:MAG: putative ATPase [Acidobacteriales bacterium]|nr:putative ATPase [Terriglobales bacterium]
MKTKITNEQRTLVHELLNRGQDRQTIAEMVSLTPGQVSAIAAHRTIHNKRSQLENRLTRALPKQITTTIPSTSDKILLGSADIGHVFWDPRSSVNPHVLIVGESGFGKTYTTSCLIAELAHRNIPSIIFDYGQGFTPESSNPVFANEARPLQLEVGRKGVAISPFEVFDGDAHGPLSVAQRIADTLVRVYQNLGVQQHATIRQAVIDVLEDAGIYSKLPSTWHKPMPRFGLLHKKLTENAQDPLNADRKTPRTAASHISSLFLFDIFRNNGVSLQWDELLQPKRRSTVIQLRGLEQNLQRATTEFLLWNLLAYLESSGPQSLRCFVVIDEAHRIPTGNGSAVERLLREGRKFGLGILLASQQPEDFTSIAFSNTATKLVFQVSDEKSQVAKQLYKKLKTPLSFLQLYKTITTLDRGCAFALTHNTGNVIRVASFNERFRFAASEAE